MDEWLEEIVLDEASTPDGDLELFALRDRDTVWIGARRKGERTSGGAVGLHTGSRSRYLETSATIYETSGLAYGGVAPEIDRVEVRNEDDEVFAGRIASMPESFSESYRAAWGYRDALSVTMRDDRIRRSRSAHRSDDVASGSRGRCLGKPRALERALRSRISLLHASAARDAVHSRAG